MSDELDDNEFESEEDKKRFEEIYKNYLRSKKTIQTINEYYVWLGKELAEKNYAVVPFKYTGIPNLPLCILRIPTMNKAVFISILN
jgi:hypothetical protein